jgi:hypothetical protein
VSGHCAPSPWMGAMCRRSNTARWSSMVVKLLSAQSKPWPDAPEEMTGHSQPRVRSSLVRVFHTKIVTGPRDLTRPASGLTIASCAQPVNTVSVRSQRDQCSVSVFQWETLPRLWHLLNPCSNVLTTKCITLCTCDFYKHFTRVDVSSH